MLPSQACANLSDTVCCTTLFDVANYILNTVYDGLISCIAPDCAGGTPTLHKYVTMGNGDDAIVDSLTVAFQGSIVTGKSIDGAGNTLPVNAWKGAFEVRLRESGWPVVSTAGDQITPPDPAMQHAMARHALGHGEKMFRLLRNMVNTKKLTPSTYAQPTVATLDGLRTLNPLGGVIGFVATVNLELPWGQQGH